MKTIFRKYLWLWEFIGVALILGVGLVAKFVPSVLFYIVGATFIILGIFRVIPLIKTTDDKLLKWIYFGEILIDVTAGVLLIILAINDNVDEGSNLLGYLVGGVLYLRALIYFFGTSLRKESTDWVAFIAHIALITVGTMIIAGGGFSLQQLGLVILVISILAAIAIGYDGYRNYNNYRHQYRAKEISKRVKKDKGVEAPTTDEIIKDREENIEPRVEENENEINA